MRTCEKCKIDNDDEFIVEIGNPDQGGIAICLECAANALFLLSENGIIVPENVKKVLNMP